MTKKNVTKGEDNFSPHCNQQIRTYHTHQKYKQFKLKLILFMKGNKTDTSSIQLPELRTFTFARGKTET